MRSRSSTGVEVGSLLEGIGGIHSSLINVTLSKDTATSGAGFTFALPQGVFVGAPADAPIEASLLDGGPLPAWLRYDAGSRSFVAAAVPDGAFPLQILIRIDGREIVIVVSERPDESR